MTLDAEDLFLNLTSDKDEIFGYLTDIPNGELGFFYLDDVNDNDPCEIIVTRTFYVQDLFFTNGTVNETDLDNEYTVGCPQTVTVIDTTPPVVNCPENEAYECLDPSNISSADFGGGNATDECDLNVKNITVSCCGGVDQDGNLTITRNYTATDQCGNSASCEQTITISCVDEEAPVPVPVPVGGNSQQDHNMFGL